MQFYLRKIHLCLHMSSCITQLVLLGAPRATPPCDELIHLSPLQRVIPGCVSWRRWTALVFKIGASPSIQGDPLQLRCQCQCLQDSLPTSASRGIALWFFVAPDLSDRSIHYDRQAYGLPDRTKSKFGVSEACPINGRIPARCLCARPGCTWPCHYSCLRVGRP